MFFCRDEEERRRIEEEERERVRRGKEEEEERIRRLTTDFNLFWVYTTVLQRRWSSYGDGKIENGRRGENPSDRGFKLTIWLLLIKMKKKKVKWNIWGGSSEGRGRRENEKGGRGKDEDHWGTVGDEVYWIHSVGCELLVCNNQLL